MAFSITSRSSALVVPGKEGEELKIDSLGRLPCDCIGRITEFLPEEGFRSIRKVSRFFTCDFVLKSYHERLCNAWKSLKPEMVMMGPFPEYQARRVLGMVIMVPLDDQARRVLESEQEFIRKSYQVLEIEFKQTDDEQNRKLGNGDSRIVDKIERGTNPSSLAHIRTLASDYSRFHIGDQPFDGQVFMKRLAGGLIFKEVFLQDVKNRRNIIFGGALSVVNLMFTLWPVLVVLCMYRGCPRWFSIGKKVLEVTVKIIERPYCAIEDMNSRIFPRNYTSIKYAVNNESGKYEASSEQLVFGGNTTLSGVWSIGGGPVMGVGIGIAKRSFFVAGITSIFLSVVFVGAKIAYSISQCPFILENERNPLNWKQRLKQIFFISI